MEWNFIPSGSTQGNFSSFLGKLRAGQTGSSPGNYLPLLGGLDGRGPWMRGPSPSQLHIGTNLEQEPNNKRSKFSCSWTGAGGGFCDFLWVVRQSQKEGAQALNWMEGGSHARESHWLMQGKKKTDRNTFKGRDI